MKKRVIFGIILFLFIGFFAFTFANPNEKVENEKSSIENKKNDNIDSKEENSKENNVVNKKENEVTVLPTSNENITKTNNTNNTVSNTETKKEETKDNTKEEVKDESKDNTKDEIKDESKDNTKDEIKDESKNNTNNEVKDESKNNTKDEVKDESKNNTKDEVKDESKDNTKDDSKDSLKKYKEKAIKEVKDYNKDVLYSSDNEKVIESIKKEAIKSIESSTTKEEIDSIVDNTKKEIDSILKLVDTYFNVVFKDEKGNILSEQSVLYGESAIEPTDKMTYENKNIVYDIKSWDKNFSSIKSDLIITGKYEINEVYAAVYRVVDDMDLSNISIDPKYYTKVGNVKLKINDEIKKAIENNKRINLTKKVESYVDDVLPQTNEEYYYNNFYSIKYEPNDGFHIDFQKTFDKNKYYQDKLNELKKLLNDDYSDYKETKTTDSYNDLINTINNVDLEDITIEQIEEAIEKINNAIANLVDVVLENITISRNNDIYYLNQNMNEIKITAIYNDQTRNKEITDYTKIGNFDSGSYGEKSITYSYLDKSVVYSYKVNYTNVELDNLVKNTSAEIKKNETCTGKLFDRSCVYTYSLKFYNLNTDVSGISVVSRNGNMTNIAITKINNNLYEIDKNSYDILKGNNTLFAGNIINIKYSINNQEISKNYVEYFNMIKPY